MLEPWWCLVLKSRYNVLMVYTVGVENEILKLI